MPRSTLDTIRNIALGLVILAGIAMVAVGPVVFLAFVLAAFAALAWLAGTVSGSLLVGVIVFAGLAGGAYIVLSAPTPRRRRHGQGNNPPR